MTNIQIEWKSVKLNDICKKITDGEHLRPKTIDKGVYFLSAKNITDEGLTFDSPLFISQKDAEKFWNRCNPEKDDLLVVSRGTIGKSCIVKTGIKFCLLGSVILIKVNAQLIASKFLNYFFKSNNIYKQLLGLSGSTVLQAIYIRDIKKLDILLPPISIQQKIVEKIEELFSELDSGVEELKKVREQLKIYRQSVLNAAFNGKLTEEWRNQQNEDWKYELVADSNKSENSKFQLPEDWNQTNIGSICNISMGQSPPGDTYNKENKGLPLINGPVEFGPNPFSKTVLSKWTTKPTKICEEGDLLLCVRGSTTGRQNIAGFKACLGRGVCSIRATKCYQLFVNHYFNFSRSKIFELGTGSTFPNISREQIYNYPISLPSLNEQKKIVQEIEFRLSIADEVEKTINESLQKAESLKQSILKKAFEGKLV